MLILFKNLPKEKNPQFNLIDNMILGDDIERKFKKIWKEYCDVELSTFRYKETELIPPKIYISIDGFLDRMTDILKHKKDKRVEDLINFLEIENLIEAHTLKRFYIANLKEASSLYPYLLKKHYLEQTRSFYESFLYEFL